MNINDGEGFNRWADTVNYTFRNVYGFSLDLSIDDMLLCLYHDGLEHCEAANRVHQWLNA